MTDVLAITITVLVIAMVIGAWVFYLRRIRQNRADPVVDPSWPSTVRPPPRYLHEPSTDPEHSLHFDPGEPEAVRRRHDGEDT
jgi:hypothetical protein